jgi:metal-responsive CopG/Arc/MetJ family transcriptional regulator
MTIKTAISIDESLFDRAEALAHELNISRSHLFALAAQAFIERHDNEHLLETINCAYDDLPDPLEQTLRQGMRIRHRRMVEGQW